MKAIAVVPGTAALRMVDRPEPSITSPDEVKVRIARVGICGTDREQAAGGRALAPRGHNERWGDHLDRLITNRYSHTEFAMAFEHHDENEIKTVLEWGA